MNRIPVALDLRLNLEEAGVGPPLALLHGFTGSARSWSPLVESLQERFTTLAVDIAGHGDSDKPSRPEHYRMKQAAADVMRAVTMARYSRAHWLGYSMGGRLALAIAAYHPGVVGRLILIGASPGLKTEGERQARRDSDEAIAQHIEADGVAKFVDYWEKLPLFASQQRLPDAVRARIRAGRLANSAVGLVNSLRGMGTGSQEPLWERLPSLSLPALLLAGKEDEKYSAIGREMVDLMPNARFVSVPAAGHAAHIENPEFCTREIVAFLAD